MPRSRGCCASCARSLASPRPCRASYAQTTGYHATAGGTTSTASAGLVVGLPDGYRAAFPKELRQFVGARTGVLVAQQMAANLGVGVGDTIAIGRSGMPDARVRIDGIVDFTAPQQLLLPPRHAGVGASAGPRQRRDPAGRALAGALRPAGAHPADARPPRGAREPRPPHAAPRPVRRLHEGARPRQEPRDAAGRRRHRGQQSRGGARRGARGQPLRPSSPSSSWACPAR